MAVLANIFFNRTLKQFLACKDLNSPAGEALTTKISSSAKASLDKILEVIPRTRKPHSDVLKAICDNELNRDSEDHFLDNLENDNTDIRNATFNVLSHSQRINPSKLFKRLHEKGSARSEIINILELHQDKIQPELYVKNAIKLNKGDADRLFSIALKNAKRTNMSALSIDLSTLDSPDIKIQIIRFLSAVNRPETATLVCEFLADESIIVIIEALKNLKHIQVEFDPSPIIRHIPALRKDEVQMAFDVLNSKSSVQSLTSLTALMTGKSDLFRLQATKIVVELIDKESLEPFLLALEKHEDWGKEQAVGSLIKLGNETLFSAAAELVTHQNEFVAYTAEQLSANVVNTEGDITTMSQSLFNEDWQIRDRAIENIGKSNNISAVTLLSRVVVSKPESSIAVLKALRDLGFSKGLEIAALCLKRNEAAVQREALLTICAIVTEKHASTFRDGIIKRVPEMQATVRDTALDTVRLLTRKFNLPKLNIDENVLFETRLVKLAEIEGRDQTQSSVNQSINGVNFQSESIEKTEVINFQNIEELKSGDYWMDRFRVRKEIGRGAMGRVMLVDDETVGESLILKFMHPELTADVKARERFLRELKYARKISHQNVIRIHDFLVKGNVSAISMEYFESEGLDVWIKENKLTSVNLSLKILYQVSSGMWAAHQQGVIHRDLKPSNILIDDNAHSKVVDFGIASANSENDATLTKTGLIIGTPAYISPERAKGFEADHRSDIYALGIIAYYMFNGRLPYIGEPISLLFQHIEGKAAPLHSLGKGVPVGVSMLVEKMMTVDIEKRYQSMQEISDDIKKLMK